MPKEPPEPLYTFRGSMTPVHCLLVNIKNDCELLYAGTQEGYVHVWDLKMKREITRHKVGSEACLSIIYKDGFYITQLKADSVRFWTEENDSWKLKKIISIDYAGFCTISMMENLIYIPDNDSNLMIYDILKNKEVSTEKKKDLGQIMCLKCINSMEKILIVYESGDLLLYNKKIEVVSSNKFSSDCPMAVDICESSGEGIIGSVSDSFFKFTINEKTLSIEKLTEGKLTNPGVSSVAINDAGNLCVLGCWDGRIRYFSMKKLKLLAVLCHHTEAIQCVTFLNKELSFCGNGMVIAGGKDTRISLWDLYVTKTK